MMWAGTKAGRNGRWAALRRRGAVRRTPRWGRREAFRVVGCLSGVTGFWGGPHGGASLLSPCVFRQRTFCPPLLRSRSGGGEVSRCLRQLPAACALSAFCQQVVRLSKVASALYPQKKVSRVRPSRVALRLCQSLFRLFRDAAPAASVASPVFPGPFYLSRFPGRPRSFPVGPGRRKLALDE